MTPDIIRMAEWLKLYGVTTVAIESTGVFWVPVAAILEEMGFDVHLVDARQAKHMPGRKTDVKDCQWLRQLHQFGLLRRAYRPEKEIEPLRALWRYRKNLTVGCATQITLMHKTLEQMNLQLHKVITDVMGLTGMRILRAIVAGERDPEKLVLLCHPGCKRPKADFIKALSGHYREEQLYILRQVMGAYDFHQSQMADCDHQIESYIITLPKKTNVPVGPLNPNYKAPPTYRRKNQVNFDLRTELIGLTGVDLTMIEGISDMTALTVLTEQGFDLAAFPTEKHFASHLGLCPNNIITGGRVKRRGTRKVSSRAATALRVAAMSLHHSHSAMGSFYRKIFGRLGAPKAITAVAHKLAKLIFRMIRFGAKYVHQTQSEYETNHLEHQRRSAIKNAKRLGMDCIDMITGEIAI
jgi:transposase